jgi:uncharacterized membrane protein YecN with MAPEG domain
MVPVNYLAIILSTVVMMVLGYVWYGPLFGSRWAHLMGFSHEHMAARAKGMKITYVIMTLGAFLMSFILAHAIIFAGTFMQIGGVFAGMLVGFMNWLGFIVPVSLSIVLWDNKPWKLWLINAAYYLVGIVLVGAILGLWV